MCNPGRGPSPDAESISTFDCTESSLLSGLFSSCSARASNCGGFTFCRAWALGCRGFSNHGSGALEHRLSSYST